MSLQRRSYVHAATATNLNRAKQRKSVSKQNAFQFYSMRYPATLLDFYPPLLVIAPSKVISSGCDITAGCHGSDYDGMIPELSDIRRGT